MKKCLSLLFVAGMGISLQANAQKYLGVSGSSYSGFNQVYLNPASASDSRHKLVVDLFSLNVYGNNSVSKAPFNTMIGDFDGGDDGFPVGKYFKWTGSEPLSLQLPFFELRGPGIMYAINNKHTIGLSTRVRFMTQVHDISSNFASLFAKGRTLNPNDNYVVLDENGFDITTHLFSDIGLSWGGLLLDKGKHVLHGGVTARYYSGISYYNLNSTGMNGRYEGANDYVRVDDMDVSFSANTLDPSDRLGDLTGGSGFFDFMFGASAGRGIGGDLGLMYEYRPDVERHRYEMDGRKGLLNPGVSKHKVKAGVSILDIGKIKYSAATTYNASTSGVLRVDSVSEKLTNVQELEEELDNSGFKLTNTTGEQKVALPTTLVFQADYNIWKGFFVQGVYMQNLSKGLNPGNNYYNQVTIAPRFESKFVDVGVPLTYNMMSSEIKAGLGVRLLFLTVGTDDVMAFVNDNSKGMNLYFGMHLPILHKKKPKDSDGDLISNRFDKCPFEKGVPDQKGCPDPDKDGDGVLDKDDLCPDVFGSKTARGCPDADLDSLADAEDRCPTEAGPVALQGCPDRDNDGVADIDDLCPDVPGLPQFKGCPDTDGDGVPDNEDKCPEVAGPVANEGCPDTDNDGVPDHMDKCPTVPGTVENQGCPEVREEVKKRLAFAATAIQFQTGKAVISTKSHKLLDEVVGILNEYTDYNMTIHGYTDNVGKDETNLRLSKERADAVRDYFIKKGIAAERLSAEGFGATNFVADNKTAAGRAKNRRVEMDLKLR